MQDNRYMQNPLATLKTFWRRRAQERVALHTAQIITLRAIDARLFSIALKQHAAQALTGENDATLGFTQNYSQKFPKAMCLRATMYEKIFKIFGLQTGQQPSTISYQDGGTVPEIIVIGYCNDNFATIKIYSGTDFDDVENILSDVRSRVPKTLVSQIDWQPRVRAIVECYAFEKQLIHLRKLRKFLTDNFSDPDAVCTQFNQTWNDALNFKLFQTQMRAFQLEKPLPISGDMDNLIEILRTTEPDSHSVATAVDDLLFQNPDFDPAKITAILAKIEPKLADAYQRTMSVPSPQQIEPLA